MPEYKNGKIYQIVCNITGETYIGSTVRSLEERLQGHKKMREGHEVSKQIVERGDYYIELLETYPCESRNELLLKETEYQKNINCINKVFACRTRKEYLEENKERVYAIQRLYSAKYRNDNKQLLKEKEVAYRDANKEKISQKKKTKVECECGSFIRISHLERHKRSQKHLNYIA